MTELLILDISWCELRTVDLGAFNGLTKLTGLTMRGNQLCELLTGTFESLRSLENLDLSNNRIEHIDNDLFSGLINLKLINLSANKLKSLHPNTFLGIPNLRTLYLGKNPGFQIPTDRNFINSHSLSTLDISKCNISSLSVETFAKVSELPRLDLSDNNLKSLDINILRALPKLFELYLYGNPLQCDYQLKEVRQLCEDRNIQTGNGSWVPKCDTPSDVKGMGWEVLETWLLLDFPKIYYEEYIDTSYSKTYSDWEECEN